MLKLAALAANDERPEDEERHSISKLLRQQRKERKEEEARALLEEMQKNVEEAQARACATEQKVISRFDDYMCLQVSHAPHVCVDLDSSYFLRTDVLLAAACARLRTLYVSNVCGHMCALYGCDNSALSFVFLSRSDGQMVSPLEASLDSVLGQLQEGLRGRMGTRGPRLRILWSAIGVSLEGPKFLVLGHPRSSWRKDLRPPGTRLLR